jgi:photosystem II stability/assembly factor-like uncharacterized protein
MATGGSSGSSGAGGGSTCAAPSGPNDELCNCPPCPEWIEIPFSSAFFGPGLFAARSGRLFYVIDGELHYTDTLDGTWHPSAFPTEEGRRIVSEAPDGTLYTSGTSFKEVCRSDDAGETFTCFDTSSLPFSSPVSWAGEAPDGIHIHGSGGDYLSIDDGATFSLAAPWGGIPVPDGTRYAADLRFRPGEGRWFDLTSTLPGQRSAAVALETGSIVHVVAEGVFASGDLGTTWSEVGTGPTTLASNPAGIVAGRPQNRQGVLVHRDGAWNHIGPSKTIETLDVEVLPDGRVLALQNGGHLFVTSMPVPATPFIGTEYPASCNDGMRGAGEERVDCGGDCVACSDWHVLPTSNVSTLLATPEGTLVALDRNGNAARRSTDDGRTWTALENPANARAEVVAPDGSVYFVGGDFNFYASTDDGLTFSRVNTATLPANEALVLAASGALIVKSSGTTAARSRDGGVSWQGFELPASSELFALETGAIFVGASVLRRSRDDGETWESLPGPDAPSGRFYGAGGGAIAGYAGGVYYLSRDEGETWREIPTPDGVAVQNALRATAAGRLVYLVDHVHVSDDDGQTWRPGGDRGWFHAGTYPVELISDVRALSDGRFVGIKDQHFRLSADPASF